MIPGALHSRLLGGGGPSGPVDPLGFDGHNYFVTDYHLWGGTARLFLDMKADGTWELRNHNGNHVASGNWFLPTTGAVGVDYGVKFTVTLGAGTGGTVVNPCAAFTGLGATRTLELSVNFSGTAGGERERVFNVNVQVQTTVGPVLQTSSDFTATLNAGSTGGA